jgi:hypothetical protein
MGYYAPSVFEIFILFFFQDGACEDGVGKLEGWVRGGVKRRR